MRRLKAIFHSNLVLPLIGVFLAYSLLTLALAWPLVVNMNRVLAGRSSDSYMNPWADWWTEKALTEGLDFYYTDYLFYPRGASLVFHSFSHANTAISLLLMPLIGRFAAYNVTILLAYVLSGFGMYLLMDHLTGCRPAAFISGLVFAFHPYHVFESAHPVIVTTQWIPLFALALIRILHTTGADRTKQVLLAALWFLLTALSSWHLMMLLAGWTALYLLYHLFFERAGWAPGASRSLILLAGVIGLTVAPFLWPIIHEQLTTDATYMAVDIEDGLANDLLSFFVPNQWHPLFGTLVSEVNERLGYIRRRPAYLGYVCLGLAVCGVAAARRQTRFWSLSGLVFLFLSLGVQVRFDGVPLHTFHLPWAIPIIKVLRHPFRLNVLMFFSFAVLVGFGSRWLFDSISSRSKALTRLVPVSVACLILFEYLVIPFPVTGPPYSPFLNQLAREEGDFAVADFPADRQRAKYHMFYQLIHGKRILDGHISRTPEYAYAFMDAHPLLGPLHAGTPPSPEVNIEEQFADLANQSIRYIIIHKRLLNSDEKLVWESWVADFPPPFYEDEWVVVYRTTSAPNYVLGVGIGLISADLSTESVTQGTKLGLQFVWGTVAPPEAGLELEVMLVDEDGHIGQVQYSELSPSQPVEEWAADAIVRTECSFHVDPWLEGGTYAVTVGLIREGDGQPVGQSVEVGEVVMRAPERSFSIPSIKEKTKATFNDVLCLWGYDLNQGAESLHLTLHWQALRRMDVAYKFFVHLYDVESGTLAAQEDVMPRGWAYPTTWWEAEEVVSDEISLSLEEVPSGTYWLAVGVYDPETGARLPLLSAEGMPAFPDALVLREVTVP
jgi:hypothetical protein